MPPRPRLQFEYSEQLWPWSGYLALYLRVKDEGADFLGTASGTVTFTVVSPPGPGEAAPRHSVVSVPLTVAIIPTPHRWGMRRIRRLRQRERSAALAEREP